MYKLQGLLPSFPIHLNDLDFYYFFFFNFDLSHSISYTAFLCCTMHYKYMPASVTCILPLMYFPGCLHYSLLLSIRFCLRSYIINSSPSVHHSLEQLLSLFLLRNRNTVAQDGKNVWSKHTAS